MKRNPEKNIFYSRNCNYPYIIPLCRIRKLCLVLVADPMSTDFFHIQICQVDHQDICRNYLMVK